MELQVQDPQEQKQHLCKLCNKSFSNGKILGGHMRSHRTQKPPPKKRKKNSIPASYSLRENPKKSAKFSPPALDSQNAPAPPPQENHCKICGKGFDSSKALFGHMRHHSGRKKNSNPKSPAVGGGLLRRKRSRRTRSNPNCCASSDLGEFSSSSSAVNVEPDVEELALSLLMLSKGVGNFRVLPLNLEESGDELDDESVKLGLFPEAGRYYAEVELGIPKLEEEEEDESELGFCEEEEEEVSCENGLKSLKKCKEEEEEEEEEEGNHECDVCLKVFGTGQALGGHKRAHIFKHNLMELDHEFKPWWIGDDDDDDNGGLVSFHQVNMN